ncbi:bifunctional diguanylate cyclase/phosphodiesterase [Massilia sp. BSC265]|uniref:putative bifunctional diguanylate cyclase/phosphodiesterase n=1 Tax=Massilia sp. BSC265 TaxID=1549812 RepID=UPI0006915B0C|nr:GGDEF domain-containing phosphodiesterase [Massilia sp. BSC265]
MFASPILTDAAGGAGPARAEAGSRHDAPAEHLLRLAESMFAHSGEGIIVTAADTRIIDVNPAFEAITGYSRAEACGRTPAMLNSGRQPPAFYAAMWAALLSDGFWQGDVWNRRRSGEPYVERLTIVRMDDAHGATLNYLGIFSDITTQTLQAEHLERIAHYDPLSGLPNRCLLTARLQHSMAQARRRGTSVAVVCLDCDDFRSVNDRHGHGVGDELLVALGARLKDTIRDCDTIGRLGGDEFFVVIDDLRDVSACLPLVRRLLDAVAEPLLVGPHRFRLTGSMGIALYPDGGDIDADQLIRRADQAMYSAKAQGKNRYVIFGHEALSCLPDEVVFFESVAHAIQHGEFELYYQPIVHLRTGELNSVEALIRWRHPRRGLLVPGEFLPRLEGHPLSASIDAWVLDEALRQHGRWLAEGIDVAISVNIGSEQLQQPGFVERLKALLEDTPSFKPGRLKFEVLETTALDDLARVSRTIEECGKLGVPFALDDFGTGYSSLMYLKQLPARRIKVDQGFVRDMLVDPEDLAILEAVLGMGAAFKREVVAEGVETLEHARMLVQMGCVLGQGYGIARPMPAGQLRQWSAQWTLPDLSAPSPETHCGGQ